MKEDSGPLGSSGKGSCWLALDAGFLGAGYELSYLTVRRLCEILDTRFLNLGMKVAGKVQSH